MILMKMFRNEIFGRNFELSELTFTRMRKARQQVQGS